MYKRQSLALHLFLDQVLLDMSLHLRQLQRGYGKHRPPEPVDLDAFLQRVERELVERAMQQANGNKTEAARLLGLSRPRLYRRLVQLGLTESPEHQET